MKILYRYVLKEHFGPLMFALSALTSLMLLNYIARQFAQLVGKGLPWTVIGEFFLLSIPFTVAMTLPMAVLVSVLYAFSRLAADSEITALKASGVSLLRVMIPVVWMGTSIAVAMIAFNDQLLPRANHRLRVLQSDIGRKKPTFALREQVINEVSPGKLYLRTSKLDESTNLMTDVTIYDMGDPARRRTIYAKRGTLAMAKNLRDLDLTLHSGYMQELSRAEPGQLQRLYYRVNFVRIPAVFDTLQRDTNDNYKGDREMSICEMQEKVTTAEKAFLRARHDLEDALASAARFAATGVPGTRDTSYRPRPKIGVGEMYCAILGPLVGGKKKGELVKTAHAATVPQAPQAQQPAPPAATRRQPARAPSGGPAGGLDSIAAERATTAGGAFGRLSAGPMRGRRRLPGGDSTPGIAGNGAGELPGAAKDRAVAESVAAAAVAAANIPGRRTSAGDRGLFAEDMRNPFERIQPLLVDAQSRMADARMTIDTYDVEIQKKFALAVACIVFVLLGAPIALRFPRGGVGLTIGVSLSVFALYYVGLIAGESLADKHLLSPFWAMWAANVLFTIVGVALLARMGKEGSTARGGDMGEFWDAARVQAAKVMRKVGVRLDRRRHAS
jgi:lipopolysaccharide export system permease protein